MPAVEEFFSDFISVMSFLFNKIGRRFFFTFYHGDGYYLFLTALLPFIFMFCFDIIMSFIFSVRCRQVRFFNLLSPRSWRAFNSSAYNSLPPDRLKAATPANRFTSTFKGIYSPFIYRVNDSIRLRNGYSATYLGTKYVNGQRAYIYRIDGKLLSCSLRPARFGRVYSSSLSSRDFKKFQFNVIRNNNYYGFSRDDKQNKEE